MPQYVLMALVFTWTHDGLDAEGEPLSLERLSYQVEYSIDGGGPVYVDIPAGAVTEPGVRATYRDPATILCDQTGIARMRAIYSKETSSWSPQTKFAGDACPQPGAPLDFTAIAQ